MPRVREIEERHCHGEISSMVNRTKTTKVYLHKCWAKEPGNSERCREKHQTNETAAEQCLAIAIKRRDTDVIIKALFTLAHSRLCLGHLFDQAGKLASAKKAIDEGIKLCERMHDLLRMSAFLYLKHEVDEAEEPDANEKGAK